MDRREIITRVRNYVRDTTSSIFTKDEITDYLNEGIDRIRNIPALNSMSYMLSDDNVPNLLPEEYHHLIAVYGASRCFSQDERHYQATVFMNEFEHKFSDLQTGIESGDIIIKDDSGKEVKHELALEHVLDMYFKIRGGDL